MCANARTNLICAAVLTACMGAGCHGEASKLIAPAGWGDPGAIQVSVSATRTEMSPGDTTRITVVVHNPTQQRILLQFTSGCMIMFAVRDSAGVLLAPKGYACTADAPSLELAPGESVTRHSTWDGTDGLWSRTPLPPGDYLLTGGLDPGAVRSTSAPLRIRFLAP